MDDDGHILDHGTCRFCGRRMDESDNLCWMKEACKSRTDLKHLAFSVLHGTFNQERPGGCSCELCKRLLDQIDELCKEEAANFYNEHYPPPGGFL